MKKYIIKWDAGYGMTYEVIEAEDLDQALNEAHDMWRQEVEDAADYDAEEYTEELAEEYGLE